VLEAARQLLKECEYAQGIFEVFLPSDNWRRWDSARKQAEQLIARFGRRHIQ